MRLTGTAPIARAISTAGGVAFAEIDDEFMLRRLPGVFVAGEMLDWEAPTGGYLLQASFATGAAAGRGTLTSLSRSRQVKLAHPWPGPSDCGPLRGQAAFREAAMPRHRSIAPRPGNEAR